eukprot:TRINITY_DN29242_c0_g1_i1.p1 TRINITY_DN29242_c0_g1~~TRINITY_DN29242_c0_g1_i1.p1  ORF type:complete len:1355 (-),score=380.51 TRINITY_DN29242_c0_g1_i1:40-3651(-)
MSDTAFCVAEDSAAESLKETVPSADDDGVVMLESGNCMAKGSVADSLKETEAAGTCKTTVESEEDNSGLIRDVHSWLVQLNLAEHTEEVLAWSEEMGAATLEEIVDECLEDLIEALPLKVIQAKRLRNGAAEALEAVRCAQGGQLHYENPEIPACDDEAVELPVEPVATAKSFYPSGISSIPGGSQSFYDSSSVANDEEEYVKQRPTDRASWHARPKQSQGARKQMKKKGSSTCQEASPEEQSEAQRAAARRLEEQIREEEQQKLNDARQKITVALERSDSQAMSSAIRTAKEVGLPEAELQDAKRSLDVALRRRQQRRNDALCAVQAALEAPKDEAFGSMLRTALDTATAEGIGNLSGGQEAVQSAQKALREWELAEQQREESRMALQFALRRGKVGALQVAISQARAAGLADETMCEAENLLQDLLQKERLEKEATEFLQQALAEKKLDLLESAVALCTERHVPLRGYDDKIFALRAELQRQEAAGQKLQAAISLEDATAVRAALSEAVQAGVQDEILKSAAVRAAEFEALAQRRKNARLELCLAHQSGDTSRLKEAIMSAREVRLPSEEVKKVEDQLEELLEQERLHKQAAARLQEAMTLRDIDLLREALRNSHALTGEELEEGKKVLGELEEAARLEAEAASRRAAAKAIEEAVAAGDWDGIENSLQRGLSAGLAEEGAPVRSARAALDSLRGERELEDARRTVRETEARLEVLRAQEAGLTGPSHKKERSAIGKEIMALRGSELYVSARNFVKNPEQEKCRRNEERAEIEKKAAEERERRKQRIAKAPAELLSAMEARDEDAVKALLVEADVLASSDVDLAETFLRDCEEKRKSAEQDAALLEFCFAALDRRAFFQASVAMNEFFTEQYCMQEGIDFKLKVLKHNSVLVAFRNRQFAETVHNTAAALARQSGSQGFQVLISAEVRGPLEFSQEAASSLRAAREDAEALQGRPLRAEVEQAIKNAELRAKGKAAISRTQTESSTCSASSKVSHEESQLSRSRTAGSPPNFYVAKGGGKSQGKPRESLTTKTDADSDVFPLPRDAATMLQKDPANAETFRNDLRTFARNFRVTAELNGLDSVSMRPMGFVHQDTLRKAKEELRNLLEFYFPSQSQTAARRSVRLRVHDESGAGIDLSHSEQGFHVDHVEDFPGQDLLSGDVIVEINGQSLAGLTADEIDDTFGEHFADGASLVVVRASPK